MYHRLQSLKNKNYEPDIIFDIGSYHGNWTYETLKIFQQSKYYLFEATDYQELNIFRNYNKFSVHNVILNEKEEIVDWYYLGNTGDSIYRELNKSFKNCNKTQKYSTTLNSLFQNENFENKKIFIKIDCQGAEIPILKGSSHLLPYTDFILIEIPFFGKYNEHVPDFLEHIQFMNSIHFHVYDIMEYHYINDVLMQVDILFIRKDHFLNSNLQKQLEG